MIRALFSVRDSRFTHSTSKSWVWWKSHTRLPFLTDTMASAFFYGTLMHPKILKRVLHNDASHLQICPAILTVGPVPSYHYAPMSS